MTKLCLKIVFGIFAFYISSSFAEEPNFQGFPLLSQVPPRPTLQIRPPGIRVTCPRQGENYRGYSNLDLSPHRMTITRFTNAICNIADEANEPVQIESNEFCGFGTDFRGAYQGLYYFQQGNEHLFCSVNRTPGETVRVGFSTQVTFESFLGSNNVSCALRNFDDDPNGVREHLARLRIENPNAYLFLYSDGPRRLLDSRFEIQSLLGGYVRCHSDEVANERSIEGAGYFQIPDRLRFTCSGMRNNEHSHFRAQCDAALGNCSIHSTYFNRNWSAGVGVGNGLRLGDLGRDRNQPVYVQCGGDNLDLDWFRGEVVFPLRRQRQLRLGGEIFLNQQRQRPQFGVGATLLLPPHGSGYLRWGPTPTQSLPGSLFDDDWHFPEDNRENFIHFGGEFRY